MACRGCSSSNQRSRSSYGCRKALQNTRWNTYTIGSRSDNGCNSCNCTTNNCNTCGCTTNNCNTCGCAANNCSTCGCNSCNCTTNGCIQPRSGSNCNRCNCAANNCSCTTNGCNTCNCATNGCIQPRSSSNCNRCNCTANNCGACNCTTNGCNSCGCTSCAGSPFYTGPCGPVDPVCCCTANCPGNSGSCCCAENCCCNGSSTAVYGHFTQEGSLELEAGDAVPFNGTSSSVGILKSGGELTLTESGAYMISLSVNIPANVTLSTDFVTLIDDGIAAGGTIMIDKTQTNAPLHAHTQTVVSVDAGSVIRIASSESVNLSCCDQIVVLTIAKVG